MSSAGYSPPVLNGGKDDEESQVIEPQQPLYLPVLRVAPVAKLVGTAQIIHHQPIAVGTSITAYRSTDLPLNQKRILFLWLCVASGVYVMLFFASLLLCLISVMIFDAGLTFQAQIGFAIVLCIPVLLGWAIQAMWQAYGRKNYRLVLILSILPGIAVVAYTVGFFYA